MFDRVHVIDWMGTDFSNEELPYLQQMIIENSYERLRIEMYSDIRMQRKLMRRYFLEYKQWCWFDNRRDTFRLIDEIDRWNHDEVNLDNWNDWSRKEFQRDLIQFVWEENEEVNQVEMNEDDFHSIESRRKCIDFVVFRYYLIEKFS